MRFKLSGLALLSLVLYVVINIWNSNNSLNQAETLAYSYEFTRNMTRGSLIIGLLSIFPSVDFMIKAFKKHYRGEEHTISVLSVVLTVASLGMPFFAYAYVSFMMKILFGSQEEYDIEKWGFIVGTVFTLGFVWLVVLFAIGPSLFVYRKVIEGIYKTEESSGLESASLIVCTIFTLGLIWLGLGIGIIFGRVFFVKAWNTAMNQQVEITGLIKGWAIFLSIITVGILPVAAFSSYWTYELFINNVEDQIV